MSYRLFLLDTRKAAKRHTCIWCGRAINPGETYTDERSVYDSRIQRHRWHPECERAARAALREELDGEFTPYENDRPTVPKEGTK